MTTPLNKTALKQERDQLQMYERFLPSLDLKRQQLIAVFQQARASLAETERELEVLTHSQTGLFALLGASDQDLSGLVCVASVVVSEENVLGSRLPKLDEITFERTEYSMLSKPFWVDFLVECLQNVARITIRQEIERQRTRRLEEAVRRITQRVNLFEQVLIPQAKSAIQRIRIYLSDAERAAVVRSKIAKAKQQRSHVGREVI